MKKTLIDHQMQPCPINCVSTCLAMIAGHPCADIIERFHLKYRKGGFSMRDMLNELRIPFQSFDSADEPALECVGAYLCTVPSLNIRGGIHQIIVELDDEDYWVIDPVMGREEKFYYVKRGTVKTDLEVELGGFVIDAFIDAEWLRAR